MPASVPFLTFELKGWKGLNTLPDITEKDPHYLEDCANIDLDDQGIIAKRRGCRHVMNVSGRVNSIYPFQSVAGFGDGTNEKVLIFAGNVLSLIHQFDENNTVEKTFSVTNNLHYCVSTNNGACFVSNEDGGIPNMLIKIGSTWSFQTAALYGPSTASTVAVGTTGSGSGSYEAIYTYIDVLGNESNPSTSSNSVALIGSNLDVKVYASTDSTVNQIGIYILSPGGTDYNYVGTTSNTTQTYSASFTDVQILSGDTVSYANDPCPEGKYLCLYNDMLIVAGSLTKPDQIYCSNWMFHRQFTTATDFDRVTTADGQPVRGFGYLYGDLVVCKADSLFLAAGSENTSFHTRNYNPHYGALSYNSITGFRKRLAFYSEDGIYVDSGSIPEEISRVIRTTTRNLNPVSLFRAPSKQVSAHYTYYKKLMFAVRSNQGSEGENDTILVYNYELDTWTIYKNIEVTALSQITQGEDYEFMYAGNSSGNIFQFAPPNSNVNNDTIGGTTTSITSYAETVWIHLPKAKGLDDWARMRTEAAWLMVYAGGEPAPGNSTISLQIQAYTDFNTTSVRATYTTTHLATAETSNSPKGIANCDPKLIKSFLGNVATFEWLKLRFTNNTAGEHYKIHKLVFGFRARPAIEE